ncbi:hypothetical protein [Vineibacter terrae]|uniref:hypothetical protein n=1 Tax=Vineibacter terrae TaxID=2586908 RepID=UPI001C4982D3|nr:hypothetical protein [Vineibacter terrae]
MIAYRFALSLTALTIVLPVGSARAGDYPTPVIVDYVIGCMASNGETQDMLRRCSCSIDAIASIIPYETYEQAETIMRMQQTMGAQATLFRNTKALKVKVDELRLAQVEADFRCF